MDVRLSKSELFLFPKMYLFYRNYPVLAARDILGLKLSTHQRIDLRLMWQTQATDIIRVFSRGMSKTFGEALIDVLMAVLYPGLRILALGAEGFRQGKMILEECERIIRGELDGQERDDFVYNMVDFGGRRSSSTVIKKDPDLWKIPFMDRSVIATAPLGNKGEAIRGFRSHITQIDERKGLSKKIKDEIIKPFSIVDYNVITQKGEYRNKNIDSGTLQYHEDDYTKEYEEYLRLIESGREDFLVIKFIYPDAFDEAKSGEDYKYDSKYFGKKLKFWSIPYGIKVDEIEKELGKLTVNIESWRSEYLCDPMRGTGDYYPFELIQSVVRKKVISDEEYMNLSAKELEVATQFLRPKLSCGDPVGIGVDVGREHDLTSFTVIRIGQLSKKEWNFIEQEGYTPFSNLIWAYEEQHMHDPEIALMIYKILGMFENVVFVALDKRGGGTSVRDQLYHVVQDKKIDAEVLFDPTDNDEGGIATLLKGKMGTTLSQNNKLRLLTYQDSDNTMVNRSLRSAMIGERFYFSGGDEKLDPELTKIQSFINAITRQFLMIKTKPTQNWLHFETPNPEIDFKDLFSSTIYNWGEIMKLIHDEELGKNKIKAATIAPTLTLQQIGK